MSVKRVATFSFLIITALLFLSGCGKKPVTKNYKIELEVWGLFDDRDVFSEIFDQYKKINPQIAEIEYKKLTPDTYKKELLEALASGKGPDIFLVHNDWVPSFKNKIAAVPNGIITEQKFKKDFVDVAAGDFIDGGNIYAVPLSVDSLGLYYNKDLFNAAGITRPPENWDEFMEDVKKITTVDSFGQITRSGAALGTAYNINRSADVLNLFMLQNKTEMVDRDTKRVLFDQTIRSGEASVFPGENALNFYTQFAKSSLAVYSWNPRLHYSIDSFSEGATAMMFNYSWHISTIESKSPKLNFSVAPVPQLPGSSPVNYANYWGYAVAQNKVATSFSNNPQQPPITNETRIAEAWNLLKFMSVKPEANIDVTANVAGQQKVISSNFDPAAKYAEKAKRPAARRDLIEIQKNDPRIGIFAEQNLIAKTWYQADPDAVDSIFTEMIDQVNKGQTTANEALKAAASRVSQTMQE